MNARGAITHGKKTELVMKPPSTNPLSACKVFEDNGGSKELHTISDMKEELMNNGPIVSTSFVQSDAFMEKVREIAPSKKKRSGTSNQKKHQLKRQVLNAHKLSESESD